MASVGEGQGAAHAAMLMPPVDTWAIEQHGRHHPSTCRPSTRTPPQRQHDRTLEGPTALQRSHSVLQEQQWNNQGQAVQVFEAEPENEFYLLPGTREKPKVQVDKGRNCYPTSFKFVSLARLSKKTQKSTPWDLTFSSRSLRETSQIK